MSTQLVTVLIPYYNFSGNRYCLENLENVTARLRQQNVYVIVVEMIYAPDGEKNFGEVTQHLADEVHQMHCKYMYWYKELLLNYGLTKLSKNCEVVAWVDGDILFEENNWVSLLLQKMNDTKAVQLFSEYVPLDEGVVENDSGWIKSCDFKEKKPSMMSSLLNYRKYQGIHGLAWAMNRHILDKIGFYDKCILGGGDKVMLDCCLGTLLKTKLFYYYNNKNFCDDINLYFCKVDSLIGGNVGVLEGRIFHLYHGSYKNRQYLSRYHIFDKLGFDVDQHLARIGGVYNLNLNQELGDWNSELANYYKKRNRNY